MAMPKPTVKTSMHSHGFGFDPRANDYKLVRIADFYPTKLPNQKPTTHVEVYYLNAGSWKMSSKGRNSYLDGITIDYSGRFPAYLEGAVHFAAKMKKSNDPLILSFDLCDEVFQTMMLPDGVIALRTEVRASFTIDLSRGITQVLGIWNNGHILLETKAPSDWENLILLNKPNDAFSRRRVSRKRTWHIDMEPNNVENDGGDCNWKPRVHMTFDTEQEAYNFYNAYGGRMGFSIRRGYVNKNKEGQITSRLFVCNKEGFHGVDKRDPLTKNPRQEVRTGCQARLIIKWDRNIHKFFVGEFVEQHNHIFVPTECTHMLPSQRKISASQATEIDLAKKSGIQLNAAFELMGNEVGERELLGFTKVDQKNYLRTKRQNSLAYGEAGSILQYFREKTLENPSFFYSVQETIIFGAALMYDETADSFIWLFRRFLEVMSSKASKTMFTDQDAAMAKAIPIVMSNTKHRLCT
ncbi:protein FAR1-RELATED SEQUENCE 5-like [Camellia sinensis]|uniref:protein FAR1-RELATED SEQUENCE 5-like n=1 Tax=Camellia sinensis TaxID=4442 RepID=UPI00103658D9|nr:protein FAR1-RELATED SEQUENCE 5-like [Camellia sinensis]